MSTWFETTIRRSPAPLPPDASRDSLIAAVLANPDDDGPRRVYADWLLDQGDPRGEFILVQCTLAQLDDDSPHAEELRAREKALLAKHKKDWVGRFRGARIEYGVEGGNQYVKGNPTYWTFERGFVDTCKMSMGDFAVNAEALLACEPVRMVNLTRGDLPGFLETCPSLDKVRGLGLARVKLRRPELTALFGCRRLDKLRFLNLTQCGIGMTACQMAAAAIDLEAMPKLRHLAMWGNSIGDRGVAALVDSPFVARLRELSLGKNKIEAAGGRALVHAEHLEQIEALSLRPHKIPTDVQRQLIERFGERVEL